VSYQFDFSVIWQNWHYLVAGVYIAAVVTVASLLLSLPLAILVAICQLSKRWWLRAPALVYVTIFRNTPTLVQLIWVYYCLPILLDIPMTALTSCILALALSAAGYMGEIFRGGIQSIDVGQTEAGRAIGLNYLQLMRRIIFPQALRRMIPPTVNEIVTLFKYSSLVSVLGVADLTYQAQVLSSTTFRPLEIFTFLGIEYLVICTVISVIARRVEQRLSYGEVKS
jgi:His/Glu/Gln/Arg/opine family amino acid ABC transporter permease subunit